MSPSFNNCWSKETIHEIINDLLCFELILEVKRQMKNDEAKAYVVSFLKVLSPIFLHEIITALHNMGAINRNTLLPADFRKKVNHERQLSAHKVIISSDDAVSAIQKMGIDFSKQIYDINIIAKDNQLYDINFEAQIAKVDDFDFWDLLFTLPHTILDTIFSVISPDFSLDEIWDRGHKQIHSTANRLDDALALQRYAYSTNRLFVDASALTELDKIWILYRYRMLTSLRTMSSSFPTFSAEIDGKRIIDLAFFFRKYQALVIDILGKELLGSKTPFAQKIREELDITIHDKNFFSLNRKIRNNLHYETTTMLSDSDKRIVDENQRVYLSVLEKHFRSSVNIQIDKECIMMTKLSNAYRNSNIAWEDFQKNYIYYYCKFRLTGKID